MRDIKFRAWDKVRKLMQYPDEIWVKKNSQWNCVNRVNGFAISETDNLNGELMQFTGLHDKNGKEIYEGDIVRCGYGYGKVIFVEGCFMVEWIDDPQAEIEFLFSAGCRYERIKDDRFQIIGNIHENPELLTKQ